MAPTTNISGATSPSPSAAKSSSPDILDLAIIGAGPAALTAATYAARAGLSTTVFERTAIGGALTEISHIANFPGFDGPGPDLAKAMRSQAEASGASITYGTCTDIRQDTDHFALTIDEEPYLARTVLIATGSEPRHLDPALESVLTVPISYCALCDGVLIKDQRVAVVGGANSAFQEALYLAKLANTVTIISHSAPKADSILQERVAATTNIDFRQDTEPTAELLNQFDHIFVFIGKRPATTFLTHLIAESDSSTTSPHPNPLFDQQGYLCTITPNSHVTPVAGLFVAGDVRSGALRQAITAAADGATAAVEVAEYLGKHKNY